MYPPVCSQRCLNSYGGFTCSCFSGYSLSRTNNRTCIANGTLFLIYSLQKINLIFLFRS